MKKIVFAIAMAIASLNSAQAQAEAPAANPARFFIAMGLTGGGDKLATAYYRNGNEVDLHGGGIIQLSGGLDYQVTPQFSFQASIGYHIDRAPARNGDMRFQRFPMELLAYYHVAPSWRIGGGARYASSAKFSSSGAADIGDFDYKSSVGGVVEAEYLMTRHWGFKLRYVAEKFEEKVSKEKTDGNHVGLFANYYF